MTVFSSIKIRQLTLLIAALLVSCAAHTAEKDHNLLLADWDEGFDSDEFKLKNFAAMTVGRDNQGNQLYDAVLQVPVFDYVLIDAGVGKSTINDQTPSFSTKSYRLGFATTRDTGLNFYLGARSWGKKQTIETSDNTIEVSYQTRDLWRFGIQYETGEVKLFIIPAFSSRLASITSDRDAWGFSTSHVTDTGAWWLSYMKRDYELNLPALDSNRILQFIIDSIALDQAYALSSEEYDLGYEWYLGRYDISFQFSSVTSVVNNSKSNYLGLAHRYYVDEDISLQTSIQNSLDENLVGLTIGLGILW